VTTQYGVSTPHTLPQAPHEVADASEVSQPLVTLLSQSPQAPLQTGTQACGLEVPHLLVPCEFVHASPQLAQLVSVPSAVSQPFRSVRSQSPKFALQLPILQVCVLQSAVAFVREHGVPQVPQFVSVLTAVSQPLSGLPSQLLKPLLHCGLHTPETQWFDELFWFVHALSQAEQLVSVPSCVHALAPLHWV
jgi:hypothetical protein